MFIQLFVLLSLLVLCSPLQTTLILDVEDGQIQGDLQTSTRGDQPYAIFYGVPYAKPPVGTLRFKAPQPVDPWKGVFDNRISMKSACLQDAFSFEHASEDCLYLNVATPALENGDINQTKSLAVMVWIHGGGWVGGSFDPIIFNPDFFMDHDVVFVGINYRLGALGFFALENQAFGNQGLRDQTMALLWVHQNIHNFGGDPAQVTIFGESSGSCSVFYQSITPLAEALFHRAIAQSGGNLGPGLGNSPKTQEKAFKMGAEVAANAGCSPSEDDIENFKLMECLQNIEDGFAILNADVYGSTYANVDEVLGDDSFLPRFPRDILESGNMNKVDIILGVNQDEGLSVIIDILMDPLNDTKYAKVREHWETDGPYMLFDQHVEDVTEAVIAFSKEAAAFYLSGSIDNYNSEHIAGIVNMYSDAWYWYTMDDWARLGLQNGLTTFQYIFSHDSLFGLLFLAGVPDSNDYGVCHGDEISRLFGGALSSILPTEDEKVSRDMVRWWTNFAKYG